VGDNSYDFYSGDDDKNSYMIMKAGEFEQNGNEIKEARMGCTCCLAIKQYVCPCVLCH